MNRIRELRVAAGWRQVDLADRLHIKKNTVCRYERESLGIDATMIHALCDLFDCSADYLLCRSAVRKSTFTDEEARLLEAFRAADPDLQDLIRRNLKVDAKAREKKAVS